MLLGSKHLQILFFDCIFGKTKLILNNEKLGR